MRKIGTFGDLGEYKLGRAMILMNRDQRLGYYLGMIEVCGAISDLMNARTDLHGTTIDTQLGQIVDRFIVTCREGVNSENESYRKPND